jgi:hypothetical protein
MNYWKLYRMLKGGWWILRDYQGHGSYTSNAWDEVTQDAWHELHYQKQHNNPNAIRCLKFEHWGCSRF